MNQPRSVNPALVGPAGAAPQPQPQPQQQHPSQQQPGYPPQGYQQQGQPPPQQGYPQQAPPQAQPPPQGAGPSGLLGPDGQPAIAEQQLFPIALNPNGVQLPTYTMNPHEIVSKLQTVSGETLLTWIEVALALSARDAFEAWLDRRLRDIEAKLGLEAISFEAFMAQQRQEMESAMAAEAQGQQGGQQPQQQPQQPEAQQPVQPPPAGGQPQGGAQ